MAPGPASCLTARPSLVPRPRPRPRGSWHWRLGGGADIGWGAASPGDVSLGTWCWGSPWPPAHIGDCGHTPPPHVSGDISCLDNDISAQVCGRVVTPAPPCTASSPRSSSCTAWARWRWWSATLGTQPSPTTLWSALTPGTGLSRFQFVSISRQGNSDLTILTYQKMCFSGTGKMCERNFVRNKIQAHYTHFFWLEL